MSRRNYRAIKKGIEAIITVAILLWVVFSTVNNMMYPSDSSDTVKANKAEYTTENLDNVDATNGFTIPEYTGSPSINVDDGVPFFTEEDLSLGEDTLYLSDLDEHGRCGVAYAVFSESDKPTEPRSGSLSGFTPAGWNQAYYEDLGIKHLYDRSHLLGYQFWGQESNDIRNLITGTIYFNQTAMLEFENDIAYYLEQYPDDSVLYRVTPYYQGDELIARGVLMECQSLHTDGYKLCVWVWNVQPSIVIDYATGESSVGDPVAAW